MNARALLPEASLSSPRVFRGGLSSGAGQWFVRTRYVLYVRLLQSEETSERHVQASPSQKASGQRVDSRPVLWGCGQNGLPMKTASNRRGNQRRLAQSEETSERHVQASLSQKASGQRVNLRPVLWGCGPAMKKFQLELEVRSRYVKLSSKQ